MKALYEYGHKQIMGTANFCREAAAGLGIKED
jgi:hypothetical protein